MKVIYILLTEIILIIKEMKFNFLAYDLKFKASFNRDQPYTKLYKKLFLNNFQKHKIISTFINNQIKNLN